MASYKTYYVKKNCKCTKYFQKSHIKEYHKVRYWALFHSRGGIKAITDYIAVLYDTESSLKITSCFGQKKNERQIKKLLSDISMTFT